MGLEGRRKKKELTGFEDPQAQNLKDKYEQGRERAKNVGIPDTHSMDLFDLDEDQLSGEKVDLATGKPIDNSTSTKYTGLSMRSVSKKEQRGEDLLGDIDDDTDNDAAAIWLRNQEKGEGKGK